MDNILLTYHIAVYLAYEIKERAAKQKVY